MPGSCEPAPAALTPARTQPARVPPLPARPCPVHRLSGGPCSYRAPSPASAPATSARTPVSRVFASAVPSLRVTWIPPRAGRRPEDPDTTPAVPQQRPAARRRGGLAKRPSPGCTRRPSAARGERGGMVTRPNAAAEKLCSVTWSDRRQHRSPVSPRASLCSCGLAASCLRTGQDLRAPPGAPDAAQAAPAVTRPSLATHCTVALHSHAISCFGSGATGSPG